MLLGRRAIRLFQCFLVVGASVLLGCASNRAPARGPAVRTTQAPVVRPPAIAPVPERLPPVALGIDVLEERKFDLLAGKRIGLLTHPAGVNRRGVSTLDVLRRAPNVKIVALFAPEHGFEGDVKAAEDVKDSRHAATGLPIYSLHGAVKKPTATMLRGIDALVIDLQDIGSRSYTFSSAMVYAMAGCFERNVEVIVLDRPNPLGGLTADGPPLDADLKSYVGVFRVPYVHGLTLGELAKMAKDAPGVMQVPRGINVSDAVRAKGKLTVVPMRGWTRSMRWPDTGLRWVPTSPYVSTFDAVAGYAMVGLGAQGSGWTWGIGRDYPFRGISFPRKTPDEIIRTMSAYRIPGIRFVKQQGMNSEGRAAPGVYVEITDWDAWRPTELSFYMHKQAAIWSTKNPFREMSEVEGRTFNIHVGSNAWFKALVREGGRVDVEAFLRNWRERAAKYQELSRKYWLYR